MINEALVVSSAEPAGAVKHFATRVNAFVQGVHVRTCSLLFLEILMSSPRSITYFDPKSRALAFLPGRFVFIWRRLFHSRSIYLLRRYHVGNETHGLP